MKAMTRVLLGCVCTASVFSSSLTAQASPTSYRSDGELRVDVSVSEGNVNIGIKHRHQRNLSGVQPVYDSSHVSVPVMGGGVSSVLAAYYARFAERYALNCTIAGRYSFVAYERFCVDHPTEATSVASDAIVGAQVPSVREVIVEQLGSARLVPAGVKVQPEKFSLVGVPTLAYATTDSQQVTVNVGGVGVVVDLHAVRFSFDWGDGTAPTVTTWPGSAWPDESIQHIYSADNPHGTVRLDVDWAGTATDPFTGEMITVEGVAHTSETSAEFPIRHTHTELTDLAEQQHH